MRMGWRQVSTFGPIRSTRPVRCSSLVPEDPLCARGAAKCSRLTRIDAVRPKGMTAPSRHDWFLDAMIEKLKREEGQGYPVDTPAWLLCTGGVIGAWPFPRRHDTCGHRPR